MELEKEEARHKRLMKKIEEDLQKAQKEMEGLAEKKKGISSNLVEIKKYFCNHLG